MNAHDFVLALADQLVEQGRTVEIEEEPDSIRIWARPRDFGENAIGATAYLSPATNRWRFLGICAYSVIAGPIEATTRRRARAVAAAYGRSCLREEVTA